MASSNQDDRHKLVQYFLDEELPMATVLYVLACIPTYFWLEGDMGNTGSIEGSVVIIAMITGSILLVPLIAQTLRHRFGIGVPQRIEKDESDIFGGTFATSGSDSTEEN